MKLTKLLILSKYNYLKMMQSNIISFLSYFLKYNKSTSTFYFHTCICPTSVSGAMISIWTTVSNVMSMCCKMTTFKLVIIDFTTERVSLKTEGDRSSSFRTLRRRFRLFKSHNNSACIVKNIFCCCIIFYIVFIY